MRVFKKCSGKEKRNDYEHQKKIAYILDEMDKKENFSTLVTVPTGGGKTKIAADFCMKKLEEKGNKVLWIADRLELLKQSIERIADMDKPRNISYQLLCSGMGEVNTDKKKETRSTSKVEKISDIKPQTDMLFASVQTIAKFDGDGGNEFCEWLPQDSGNGRGKLYIIYDEAHHIGAEKIQGFLGELLVENQETGKKLIGRFGLIGLTATAYRMDSSVKSFNKWFKDGWEDGKIITNNTEYGKGEDKYVNNRIEIVSIADLIKEGILKKPEIIRVDDFENGKPQNEAEYLADRIKRRYKEWGKTIVFVGNVKMALETEEKLKSKKVECFSYTHENPDLEKLREFRETGSKGLMISVDMVSEGFDVPDVETIYLYDKILSQIRVRQRIGRVLRNAEDKMNCRVIWQKYYPERKILPNEDIKDSFETESDKDIRREVAEYKKGSQIPPGIYQENLPNDIEEERKLYKFLEFLEILDIFGTEPYTKEEGIIIYKLGEDREIFLKKSEEKGYRQYYQMIMTDYYRELTCHKEEEYKKFSGYAKILGFKTDTLLIEYVKKVCFYMSNIKGKDTRGAIIKKRLTVPDKDIIDFYEYVAKNCEMPECKAALSDSKSENHFDGFKAIKDRKIVEKKIREGTFQKKGSLIEAMKEHQRIVHPENVKRSKEYAHILPYGEYGQFQYNEMESARYLMRLGAYCDKRIDGSCGKVKGEIAFIGKTEKQKYYNIAVCHRATNEIAGNDLFLIAEALVTVPNHIKVKKEDVDEYKELLWKNYERVFQVEDKPNKDQLAREFLMALGYFGESGTDENDNIIRMQCEVFADKLPKILQYVIYCRCYKQIMKTADYCKEGTLTHECQNSQALLEVYESKIQSYGIKGLDSCPHLVKDVLYDCRPYLKVVPNYQGIKPEFLCRMLNDILLLGNKQKQTIVDAFGGSGAISMNINENLEMEQIYNDIGIMNEKLFKSIKRGDELKGKIEDFIKLVVEDRDEGKAKKFLQCYEPLLKKEGHKAGNDYDFINDSFEIIRKKFRDKDSKNGGSEEEDQKDRELIRENYAAIYTFLYNKTIETHTIQEIEEFLLPLILEVKKIYRLLLNVGKDEVRDYNLKDADIAFIFFVYNSFVARYQYSGATIDLLDRFVNGYEKWFRWGREKFGRIRVESEDALGLMERKKNEERYVWYCDIPYTGTSAQNYVEKVLNTGEFVKRLSECKGSYVVSSRFNIGDGSKNMDEKKKKEQYWNILKFYSSFLPEECIREYVEKIKEELKIEKANDNELYYISKEKKAKYILFAFTRTGRMQRIKKDNEACVGKEEVLRSNTLLKEDSIRRMLHNTQFGNIPVEIMLTDMKLDTSMMPITQLGEGGVWYMPTFVTVNSYGAEAVTIIMEYEKFVKQMLLRGISRKVVDRIDAANIAAAFYYLFKNR